MHPKNIKKLKIIDNLGQGAARCATVRWIATARGCITPPSSSLRMDRMVTVPSGGAMQTPV